jgi:hypothetical protein
MQQKQMHNKNTLSNSSHCQRQKKRQVRHIAANQDGEADDTEGTQRGCYSLLQLLSVTVLTDHSK